MAGLASGTGNKAAPLNQRKNDLYETPPEAVTALLRAWFVWDKSHLGPTELHRLSWEAQ